MNRLWALPVLLVLTACGSTSSVATRGDDPVEIPVVLTEEYETFDVSQYPDEPMAAPIEVTHQVPPALMENRADAGVEQQMAGYRVQVYATLDPLEAEQIEETVRRWWAMRAERLGNGVQVAAEQRVYRLFRQPYYRIRLGDTVTRRDAEALLQVVKERFDGAFVVPDQVTVRKSR